MKPPGFKYILAETLDQALAQLSDAGADAKLLAGGQSLVPMMNFRLVQPSALIDLNRLAELDFVEALPNGGVRTGAMVRLHRLEKENLIGERLPLLAEAMPHVAHLQIRTRGTIGGSLAHADPAAELPVITTATGARLRIRSTNADRWLDASDFFLGIFTTALQPDEMITEIEFPAAPGNVGWAFLEFSRRAGDYALAGLAAMVRLDEGGVCREARLVYFNAGDGPINAIQAAACLVGEKYSASAIDEAASTASHSEIDPSGSVHATPLYQRHLASVLTKRALELAFARAGVDLTE